MYFYGEGLSMSALDPSEPSCSFRFQFSLTHTPSPLQTYTHTYSSFTKDSGIPSLASLKAYGKHSSPHIREGGSGFSEHMYSLVKDTEFVQLCNCTTLC